MARNIDPSTEALLDDFSVVPVTLVRLDWYSKNDAGNWFSTPITLTTGAKTVEYSGETYQAIGSLGDISAIEESTELQAYSLSLSLTGIPTELVSDVFADISFRTGYINREAQIYTAFLDTKHELVGAPILMFQGRIGAATLEIGETVTIQLSADSRLTNWELLRGGRFNSLSQKALYPLDTGFDFVDQIHNSEIAFPGGIYAKGYLPWKD